MSRSFQAHPGTHRVQRDAFTLVELLVVITIISVLIGVLLPAITKAREQGKLAVCLSNMHSIATATTNYLIDYRDSFPPIRIEAINNRSQIYWVGKSGTRSGYAEATATMRFLNPYLGPFGPTSEVKVARCPNDEQATVLYGMSGTSSFYNDFGSSYAANVTGPNFAWIQSLTVYGNAPASEYGVRSSRLRDISRTVVLAEYGVYDPVWSSIDPGVNLRWHDRNVISSPVAFAGGNAKYVVMKSGVLYNNDYTFDIRY